MHARCMHFPKEHASRMDASDFKKGPRPGALILGPRLTLRRPRPEARPPSPGGGTEVPVWRNVAEGGGLIDAELVRSAREVRAGDGRGRRHRPRNRLPPPGEWSERSRLGCAAGPDRRSGK